MGSGLVQHWFTIILEHGILVISLYQLKYVLFCCPICVRIIFNQKH